MTNHEYINSLSTKELAVFLEDSDAVVEDFCNSEMCPESTPDGTCTAPRPASCIAAIERWLRSERKRVTDE